MATQSLLALAFLLFSALAASADEAPAELYNLETFVPPQCYTKTGGQSNPCYVCHTPAHAPNFLHDVELQASYAFAAPALKNHWTNLFVDRRAAMKEISAATVDSWVRTDNYSQWRKQLQPAAGRGFVPDLDFNAGFDADGLSNDGSGWRALRYVPFPGTFWPTNGSTDDVFIRLPVTFRTDAEGKPSRETYKANLSILEASMKMPSPAPGQVESRKIRFKIEPIDERILGVDLDGNGRLGITGILLSLPQKYLGKAADVNVTPRMYPQGTEFFHTVRYLDPSAPGMMARRMKEVRYAKKFQMFSVSTLSDFYEEEFEEKRIGAPKQVAGTPGVGYLNKQGWTFLGWIEDQNGILRVQNNEEQRFCLGCHATIGATIDSSFAFPRKLPGAEGWRPQDLRGIRDIPSFGAREGHALTYFKRVKGADEFRANDEMLKRFFDLQGNPKSELVNRAGILGDKDLAWLLFPSEKRAYELNKAYMLLVKEQSFIKGRDAVVAPVQNVHRELSNDETENGASGNIFTDGSLLLNFRN